MAIINDTFRYKKIRKNSFSGIEETVINETVRSLVDKTSSQMKNLHCRIHNQAPIINVSGKNLKDIKLSVSTCCSIMEKKVNQNLNDYPNIMGEMQEKAIEFASNINGDLPFSDRKFVDQLQYELDVYRKPQHKVQFLEEIITAVQDKLILHEETCTATPETCMYSKAHRNAIFFTNEELDYMRANLIGSNIGGENEKFDTDELTKVYSKIDQILVELNKLGLGQQIIFDEIESMKVNATKLSKKDFKMLFLGKIVGTGFMELLKNDVVQAFLDEEMKRLIN